MNGNTQDRLYGTRFAIVPEWVVRGGVSDRAVRLFATLHCYADNRRHTAYPSRRKLAEECGCSTKSIDRALKELVDLGALIVEQQKKGGEYMSNLYTLVYDDRNLVGGRDRGVATVETGVSPPTDSGDARTRTTELEQRTVERSAAVQGESTQLMPPGEVTQTMRRPDRLWDLFDQELGPVTNATERGRRNAALKSICQSLRIKSGTEAGDVHVAAVKMRLAEAEQRWSGEAAVTEMAIAANWRDLGKTRAGRGLSTQQILDLDLGGLFGDDEASADARSSDQRQLAAPDDSG